MARGDRFHFYRLSATQGRWMHLVVESLGVRGDDGAEVTQVVAAEWVDKPVPEPAAQPFSHSILNTSPYLAGRNGLHWGGS